MAIQGRSLEDDKSEQIKEVNRVCISSDQKTGDETWKGKFLKKYCQRINYGLIVIYSWLIDEEITILLLSPSSYPFIADNPIVIFNEKLFYLLVNWGGFIIFHFLTVQVHFVLC